jgi:hypothetical protein
MKISRSKGFKSLLRRVFTNRIVRAFCDDTVNIGPEYFKEQDSIHVYNNCVKYLESHGYEVSKS